MSYHLKSPTAGEAGSIRLDELLQALWGVRPCTLRRTQVIGNDTEIVCSTVKSTRVVDCDFNLPGKPTGGEGVEQGENQCEDWTGIRSAWMETRYWNINGDWLATERGDCWMDLAGGCCHVGPILGRG